MSRVRKGIGELFDEMAGGYDERHRRAVPCFEEFYGAVLYLIPADGGGFRVLDLGSGTGLLAAMIGKAFPESRVTLADFSKEMMNVAENRLEEEPDGRFEFHIMDYVNEPLPGKYEVVVSALSLHHVGDEEKRKVFLKAYEALEDGGVFINADKIPSGPTQNGAGHHEHYRHHESHLAHHAGAGEGDASTRETSLEEQLAWMRDAGFSKVRRTYENGSFVVCTGGKETP